MASALAKSLDIPLRKLKMKGVANMDVYNITAPFKINNKQYILGRAELRKFELITLSLFFKKSSMNVSKVSVSKTA